MILTGILALTITAGLLSWLLAPLFAGESSQGLHDMPTENLALIQLQDERERLVRILHDLELDYKTGKLTEEEYSPIHAGLTNELGAVLKKLDNLSP